MKKFCPLKNILCAPPPPPRPTTLPPPVQIMNAALRSENRARSQVNTGARRVILLALSFNLITKFHSNGLLNNLPATSNCVP